MFYRCLTVMNDNSYDNIMHIYSVHVRISYWKLSIIIYYLYIVCGTSIHIISHEIRLPSSGCWLISKEYVSYVEPITVDGGKMSKEERIYITDVPYMYNFRQSRKSTITVLNKTLEDFLLFFSSYLSLWFQCEAKFCTAMPHDTENSV